jgi:hypothetical protein
LSGAGKSKLKLSGNGNECKPLVVGMTTIPAMNFARRHLFWMCAINAAAHELPAVLYFTLGGDSREPG